MLPIRVIHLDQLDDDHPEILLLTAYDAVLTKDGRIKQIDSLPAKKHKPDTDTGRADNETI